MTNKDQVTQAERLALANAAFEQYRVGRFGAYSAYPIDAATYFCSGYVAALRSLPRDAAPEGREEDGMREALEAIRRHVDRLSPVGEFLLGLPMDGDAGELARKAYANMVGVQSFIRIDSEEALASLPASGTDSK